MPSVDVVVESEIESTTRVRQVSAMFDAPTSEKCRVHFKVDLPIESGDWNVGLVVGPSGSGKSTVANRVFGDAPQFDWNAKSIVDDFDKKLSTEAIAEVCQAVGFNTIPAWMRPYAVLSNGEKFRVDIARRLLELQDPIVVDEFTSVVDRQVAQIGSHAVQKYVRRHNRKFVAITCHYDVIDWLQPDWVLDMATQSFTRRLLQRRPAIDCTIGRIPHAAWNLFAKFHYMSSELHRGAQCFGLWASGKLACFIGILPKPVSQGKHRGTAIAGVSRIVTLPDWQGLGLAFVLADTVASAYKAVGRRFRNYPAHPAYVRACDRSPKWALVKQPGVFSVPSSDRKFKGGRPCAVFEYVGDAMSKSDALRLLAAA